MNNKVIPTAPPTGGEQRVCTWFPCLEKAAAVVLEAGPFLSAGLYMGPGGDQPQHVPYNSLTGGWEVSHLLCTGHLKTFTKFIISSVLFFKPALISCKKKHMEPCYSKAIRYFCLILDQHIIWSNHPSHSTLMRLTETEGLRKPQVPFPSSMFNRLMKG